MSKEAVGVFLQRLADDDVLRAAYAASMRTATENVMLATAQAQGLEFTAEELREALEERAAELTNDELSQVAGGVGQYAPGSAITLESSGAYYRRFSSGKL